MDAVIQALVIDDHPGVGQLIGTILGAEDVRVRLATTARQGLEILKAETVDVLFIDLCLPDGDGMEILRESMTSFPNLATVVVSGTGTMESVIEALQAGAGDYVTKPIDRRKVVSALHRALTRRSQRDSGAPPKRSVRNGNSPPAVPVVAASAAMQTVLARLTRIAATSFPILLQGETGVGKKLLARWIHSRSRLADGRFEQFSCAALRNAISGPDPAGWKNNVLTDGFQALMQQYSAGCTLLLENIDQLPLAAQTGLLGAVEGNWHKAFNDGETRPGNLRIIATIESDLETSLSSGVIHRGLYDALNLFPIVVPALRERPDDIRPLTTHFIDQFCFGRDCNGATIRQSLSEELWALLRGYAWPGNVRELMSLVARVTLSENAAEVDHCVLEHVRVTDPQPARDMIAVPFEGDLRSIERSVIREVVRRNGGNKAAAARSLGMHRRTLYRLLEKRRESPLKPEECRQRPINASE